MKISPKKEPELTMGENENPVDFFRRVRKVILARFDNDLGKYVKFLMKEQEKYKDRLVDVNELRKKGLVK